MTQSNKIQFQTSFAFASQPVPCERLSVNGLTITVESDCLGQSSKLASDLMLALEYGAFPALQALAIDRIQTAEQENKPLACTVDFTP